MIQNKKDGKYNTNVVYAYLFKSKINFSNKKKLFFPTNSKIKYIWDSKL